MRPAQERRGSNISFLEWGSQMGDLGTFSNVLTKITLKSSFVLY